MQRRQARRTTKINDNVEDAQCFSQCHFVNLNSTSSIASLTRELLNHLVSRLWRSDDNGIRHQNAYLGAFKKPWDHHLEIMAFQNHGTSPVPRPRRKSTITEHRQNTSAECASPMYSFRSILWIDGVFHSITSLTDKPAKVKRIYFGSHIYEWKLNISRSITD